MKLHALLAFILGLGLGSTAFAEGREAKPAKEKKPRMTAEEKFAKLDKNGDGVLTFEEWNYKPEKVEKPQKADKIKKNNQIMDKPGDK